MDPVLRGSLHATLHSQFVVPTDPVQVKDWSLSACSMDITLAKSYVCCSLSDSVLSDLLIAYSSLYPTIPVEDIEVNSAFRQYLSVSFKGISITVLRLCTSLAFHSMHHL